MKGPQPHPEKPLAGMFAGYRAMVIPAVASNTQVNECRKAFFAGATCLFTLMLKKIIEAVRTPAKA